MDDLKIRKDRAAGRITLTRPQALNALSRDMALAIDAALRAETAARIARVRATPEAREGLAAFLEKRPARWIAES